MLAVRVKVELDGACRAWCPSLPGCSAWGQTETEALWLIDVAMQGYLANLLVFPPWNLRRVLA